MNSTEKRKQVLVIGRFQPVCGNHVDMVEQAREYGEDLIVGIGRPNYARAREVLDAKGFLEYQVKNLFSYERTKELVEHAFAGEKGIAVVPIYDIFDPDNYASHVKNEAAKAGVHLDDCVLAGENFDTWKCFEGSGIEVRLVQDRTKYHATQIREEIYRTGKSEQLAAPLTPKEIKRVQDANYILGQESAHDMREAILKLGYEIID
ncbi:MAG: hypothetical protein KKG59_07680 [Nanoarchaeota archaeon]|nr:hypothetical protein [Nanoarchaeota archaeon]